MILYLIKAIACSGLLLAAYFLLFDKETNHRFKRFYLLSSLFFSLTIPLIPAAAEQTITPVETAISYFEAEKPTNTQAQLPIANPTNFNLEDLLLITYLLISCYLLVRFIKNMLTITFSIRNHRNIKYKNYTVVLMENHNMPYSFLHYIFLDEQDYLNNNIDKVILKHEQAHVQQLHSIDILTIEILKILFWFNPFLIFYKKAIQTNHEYLADKDVIKVYPDISAYQHTLLQNIGQASSLNLSSSFNYLTTKQRLIMMTKTSSKKMVLCKQFAVIPLIALSIFIFSVKTIAQEPLKAVRNITQPSKEGISEVEMKNYKAIEAKYATMTKNGRQTMDLKKVTAADKATLESMYAKMSKQQRKEATIAFFKSPPPLPKVVPTTAQLNAFKNEKEYGLWINEKKVANSELNKYQATDFKQVFISKLHGLAKKNATYNYQADLMTSSFYDNYIKRANASKKDNIMLAKYGSDHETH